jgi:hypothetical protein
MRSKAASIKIVVLPDPGPPVIISGLPRCEIAALWADDNCRFLSGIGRRLSTSLFNPRAATNGGKRYFLKILAKRPLPFFALLAAAKSALLHLQRSFLDTPFSAISICCPQPVQVGFLQFQQVVLEHICKFSLYLIPAGELIQVK